MRRLAMIAAVALSGCGGALDIHDRDGEDRLTIHYDEGGSIARYRTEVGRALFYGTQVRITGPCISSCTMYLALPPEQLCLHPDAPFWFHRGGATDEGLAVLRAHYFPELREWFDEHAAQHRMSSVKLTGREIVALNPEKVRLCDD